MEDDMRIEFSGEDPRWQEKKEEMLGMNLDFGCYTCYWFHLQSYSYRTPNKFNPNIVQLPYHGI
jgi:hypothetical protein